MDFSFPPPPPEPSIGLLPQIIPMEYQGWVFLIYMVVSFILIGYMFYIIATDKKVGVYK